MAELVDAPDLGSGVFGREGSSPFIRTAFGSIRALTFTVTSEYSEHKSCSKANQSDRYNKSAMSNFVPQLNNCFIQTEQMQLRSRIDIMTNQV